MQIRNYYNKTDLPPYDEYEAETNKQAVTLTPEGPQAVGQPAPNLSIITIDVNMESDTDKVSTPDEVSTTPVYPNGAHQQDRPTVITLQMEGWKRDAVTMTEEDYIRKHYYDKAETSNSTGRLLSMSLLLAITDNYRRIGMECAVGISRSRRNHRRTDDAAPPHYAVEQLYEARR